MKRLALALALAFAPLLSGCLSVSSPEPEPPANAGYCASLSLLLDSVDPRMAAQAKADMQAARCATLG